MNQESRGRGPYGLIILLGKPFYIYKKKGFHLICLAGFTYFSDLPTLTQWGGGGDRAVSC